MKIASFLLLASISTGALADGKLVEIQKTEICNFIVTKQSVPVGGEIRLRAVSDGSPIGFISVGKYSHQSPGIRGGKSFPVKSITSSEVLKVPVTEGGNYAFFISPNGMTCENNVTVTAMDSFDRVTIGNFSLDVKVYVPEF